MTEEEIFPILVDTFICDQCSACLYWDILFCGVRSNATKCRACITTSHLIKQRRICNDDIELGKPSLKSLDSGYHSDWEYDDNVLGNSSPISEHVELDDTQTGGKKSLSEETFRLFCWLKSIASRFYLFALHCT